MCLMVVGIRIHRSAHHHGKIMMVGANQGGILTNFAVAGLNESTHPRGSATVTSYAPGVHPFYYGTTD